MKNTKQDQTSAELHVVIIGGGIAGLSAAWQLRQTIDQTGLHCTVLESSTRWGGKIVTKRFDVVDNERTVGPFVVDSGPESFITRKPGAWDLACELGLREQLFNPGSETRNTYVVDQGRPVLLPISPLAFVRSRLISTRGKLRMFKEPFIPARRDDGDESLADFVRRRLGREALEKFIGPVLGGIYNTDPEYQSILTTAPVMREMERDGGSLVAGAFGRMRAKAKLRKEAKARGEILAPSFITFKNGADHLVRELVRQLCENSAFDLRLKSKVSAIEAIDGGGERQRYRLHLEGKESGGESILADAIIFASPANVAARLLQSISPESAASLAKIHHVHIGTISLGFREKDLQLSNPISGLMIPRREKRLIDAMTFTSAKFPDRAPKGYALMRVFFGGAAPYTMDLDDTALCELVLSELKELLGIEAKPLGYVVERWPASYPQAAVGHLGLVDEIEARLPAGLVVTGSSYRGLGVPDSIEQGRTTAVKLVRTLAV